ncbi:hypothetical protein L1049_013614 [Liquidambar formosana]|uniref:RNase H type-1 domain-containing protein n=1 Tax=Liquidambar formosana TaxID=63359 RepID=A0AAP0RLR9_LIQFO
MALSSLVELWALYNGHCLAWDEGFRKLYVTVDSAAVVLVINKEVEATNPNRALIVACQKIVRREWACIVEHNY